MSQQEKNPEIDEVVWQAWLKKNKVQERFRYERRLAIVILAAIFVTLTALLWEFLG
jgi:hypothetical protein